jgi:hypothetical protein
MRGTSIAAALNVGAHRTVDSTAVIDAPSPGEPWQDWEITIVVASYAEMLGRELRGERYSKTDFVRTLGQQLPARSVGSIERKLQNISAVLDEIGLDWVDGYKPLSHYQHDLRDAALDVFRPNGRIAEALAEYETSTLVAPQPEPRATIDVQVPVPGARSQRAASTVSLNGSPQSAMRDFRAQRLGRAGEAWVLDLEREGLRRDSRDDLARRVRWISRDEGDAAGYDIASFWADGRDRKIEVKTTNLGARTPFYITRWEIETSRRHAASYSLFRVHGFARDPRIYVLDGSIEELARLEPSVFLGIPI